MPLGYLQRAAVSGVLRNERYLDAFRLGTSVGLPPLGGHRWLLRPPPAPTIAPSQDGPAGVRAGSGELTSKVKAALSPPPLSRAREAPPASGVKGDTPSISAGIRHISGPRAEELPVPDQATRVALP